MDGILYPDLTSTDLWLILIHYIVVVVCRIFVAVLVTSLGVFHSHDYPIEPSILIEFLTVPDH